MATKYSLGVNGDVKKIVDIVNNGQRIETIKDYVSENDELRNTNRPSENITSLIISNDYLGGLSGIFNGNNISTDAVDAKKYIIKNSTQNVNKSFGFSKEVNGTITTKEDVDFLPLEVYLPYNSFFDLEADGNLTGKQIFADDLDFFAIPQFIKDPNETAEEILLKILTIVDLMVASLLPVLLISLLQLLIQDSQPFKSNSSNSYDYGKYISYNNGQSATGVLGNLNIILERTLNAYERLMNFPKFKKERNSGKDLLDNVAYLFLGYVMYLSPGSKIEAYDTGKINGTVFISDVLTTLITSDSMRHPFNLLIRKIIRSNYFLKKTLESPSLNTIGGGDDAQTFRDFSRTLSYLGNYFYRFIGERIAVGEKVYSIDKQKNRQKALVNDVFEFTRISELGYNNKIDELRRTASDFSPFEGNSDKKTPSSLLYKKNTSITSFRHSLDPITSNGITAWQRMSENTKSRLFSNKSGDEEFSLPRLNKLEVDIIENAIDSEYMPFSFHDLRTNEVFRYHAFIESITDGFSPNYADSTGFGRMDPVKTYMGTTRSIGLSFWMISTSPEDFDEMWYYINRMVAMVYPQWSKHETARSANFKEVKFTSKNNEELYLPFGKPFTQIPVASPLIRIRVGDLIKSNYNEEAVLRNILEIEEPAGFKIKINTDNQYEVNTNPANVVYKNLKDYFTSPYMRGNIDVSASSLIMNYQKTGGKGLAGFIRSLSLNVDQNVNWSINEGMKAPMAVKFDIQFDPIHDIPLGITYRGNLRAASYNVGDHIQGEIENKDINLKNT
jgi:hypothetical protein